jgi:endonuclease/exonuclease/phosphatase family metal-dependent hydrolase
MNHHASTPRDRDRAWVYLRDALGADLALLQEAVVPPGVAAAAVFRPSGITGRDGKSRRWGSAVASFAADVALEPVGLAEGVWRGRSLGVAPLDCVSRGHVAIAVATLLSGPVTLVSAYGLIEFGYASGTLLRVVADLEPLLDDPALGQRLIIAGDWNIGTWWSGEDRKYRRREEGIFDLLRAYGLVDCVDAHVPSARGPLEHCPCAETTCRHVWTHRRQASSSAFQDDYMFATEQIAAEIRNVEVGTDWDRIPSDHAPIVCTL